MRYAVFVFTLVINFLYFTSLAIGGIKHQVDSISLLYTILCLSFAIVSIISIIGSYLIKRTYQIRRINLFFYMLPFIIGFIYLVESPINFVAYRFITFFYIFSFPAIFIGTYVASNNILKNMSKWWDLIIIIITLGLILSIPSIINTRIINVGGIGYQPISYMAAFIFGMCLYLLLFGSSLKRFKIFSHKLFNVIYFFFLFIHIFSILLSGGRGGMVTVIFITVILLYFKFKNEIKYRKVILPVIVVFFSVLLLSNFLPSEVLDLIKNGSKRIFSYITSSGIDMSETSGRDIVFAGAWKLIKEKPLLGYGIFKYVDSSGRYPHNFILEILLQGGMVYLLFWTAILVSFSIKLKQILNASNYNLILIPTGIYPFTQLLFSGSYLMAGLFWFTIAFVFNYKADLEL